MNLLRSATDWLGGVLRSHAAEPVVYQRGTETVEVDATVGKTEFQIDDGAQLLENVRSRDFIIDKDQLTFSGAAITPTHGDRIVYMDGGKEVTCEVSHPAGKQQAAESWGPFGQKWRIHTKEISRQ